MFHNTCTQSWDHVCLYYVSILPDLQSYWIEPSSGTSLKGEPLKIESSASSIGIFILFLYYYIILALQWCFKTCAFVPKRRWIFWRFSRMVILEKIVIRQTDFPVFPLSLLWTLQTVFIMYLIYEALSPHFELFLVYMLFLWQVHLFGGLSMGVVCTVLLVEQSPPLYHAYVVMTMFLWTQIFSEYRFLKALCRYLCGKLNDYYLKLIATCIFSVIILELLVRLSTANACSFRQQWIFFWALRYFDHYVWFTLQVKSFTDRKLYTWCFLTTGVAVAFYLFRSLPWRSGVPIFVWVACWFLSAFTLLPPQIPENTLLV